MALKFFVPYRVFLGKVKVWAAEEDQGKKSWLIGHIMQAYDQGRSATVDQIVRLDLHCSHFRTCPPLPPDLTDLDLSYSSLNEWHADLPITLRTLNFSSCPIKTLPENLAVLLPNLQKLIVSDMPIDKLPDMPDTLIELNASRTLLTLFEKSSPSLQILHLNSCKHLILPANFAVLFPKLQKLDITGMLLEELPDLPDTLIELNASETELRTLPETLHFLQILRLGKCIHLTLPDNLAVLFPKLQELIVPKLPLDKLPDLPGTLVCLDVSGMPLKVLPNKTLPLLKELTLSECQDLTLPDNLAILFPRLERLAIHNTTIERLPDSLPETLVGLGANGTVLKTLPPKFPLSLKKVGLNFSPNLRQIELSASLIDQIFQLDLFFANGTSLAYLNFDNKARRDLLKREFELSATLGLNYRQTYPLSCAAASLLVVAHELGGKNIPTLDAQGEALIYKVTSGFEGKISELGTARGSLPPNIILKARQLGLEEAFYVPPNLHTVAMQTDEVYPTVTKMLTDGNMTIHAQTAPPLNDGMLEVRFMTRVDWNGNRLAGPWDEMNHCIVVRPNGSCMDPDYGLNFKTIGDYIKRLGNEYLQDTGMVIQFKSANG